MSLCEPDLNGLSRSCRIGELSIKHCGQEVVLCGWVHRRRELGALVMIDLRDHYGVVQINLQKDLHNKDVTRESVIQVTGRVMERPQQAKRDHVGGDIEVAADRIVLLSRCDSAQLPFLFDAQVDTKEELRLKYRYLDLRHPQRQQFFRLRSHAAHRIRSFLHTRDFLEIETPILYKPTPEGARDYLIPSRLHPGCVYALPQSPQMLKQLLMISGFDRYYQITKCFRDEDLRSDRQPEFTQVDMEASFVTEQAIYELSRQLCCEFFEDSQLTMPCLSYQNSMRYFGTDKPDLRYGLPAVDVSEVFRGLEFPPVKAMTSSQVTDMTAFGVFVSESIQSYSRKGLDEVVAQVMSTRPASSQNCVYYAKDNGQQLQGGMAKWLSSSDRDIFHANRRQCYADVAKLITHNCPSLDEGQVGTWFFIVHLHQKVCYECVDVLRRHLHPLFLTPHITPKVALAWVHSFPLFETDESSQKLSSAHHPFTMPHEDDMELLMSLHPENMTAGCSLVSQSYDVVCNGFELASGSMRIHEHHVQRKVFELLGLSPQQISEQFGFFLESLSYGAPPHGGIAFGFDRMMMLLAGCENLRDVIAFPKTTSASCLMSSAPHMVADVQLKAYGLRHTHPQS